MGRTARDLPVVGAFSLLALLVWWTGGVMGVVRSVGDQPLKG